MKELFDKTFSELTTNEVLEIRGLGDKQLSATQLTGLWSVVNYRYENFLPTVTYTDKALSDLCKAINTHPELENLAYAIVGRLWDMGVVRG